MVDFSFDYKTENTFHMLLSGYFDLIVFHAVYCGIQNNVTHLLGSNYGGKIYDFDNWLLNTRSLLNKVLLNTGSSVVSLDCTSFQVLTIHPTFWSQYYLLILGCLWWGRRGWHTRHKKSHKEVLWKRRERWKRRSTVKTSQWYKEQ